MFVSISLRLREIRKGDLWDGLTVTAFDYLDGSYRWTLSDGSYRWGRDFDEFARVTINRPVPAGFVDWSDDVFRGAPVVSARPTANDTWTADTLPAVLSDGKHTYAPVFVRGHYGDYLFENWPGVGPSPAPYSMKAMIRDDGKLCHPENCDRRFGSYALPVVHSSDWCAPYLA